MSISGGAPELLSQVKLQILETCKNLKEKSSHLSRESCRDENSHADDVLPRRTAVAREIPPTVKSDSNCGFTPKLFLDSTDSRFVPTSLKPCWPREPIIRVQRSLQEWVLFAEKLKIHNSTIGTSCEVRSLLSAAL